MCLNKFWSNQNLFRLLTRRTGVYFSILGPFLKLGRNPKYIFRKIKILTVYLKMIYSNVLILVQIWGNEIVFEALRNRRATLSI